jgi:hypothetical protein
MPFLMFIESPDSSDDRDREGREPWILTAIDWVLPWPAMIVWLLVASRLADGWIGFGFAYAAVLVAAWRGLRAMPAEGVNQARQ